jgi:hypothetical protein
MPYTEFRHLTLLEERAMEFPSLEEDLTKKEQSAFRGYMLFHGKGALVSFFFDVEGSQLGVDGWAEYWDSLVLKAIKANKKPPVIDLPKREHPDTYSMIQREKNWDEWLAKHRKFV